MSVRQEILTHFQRPEVHSKIMDYLAHSNIDPQELTQEALLKVLGDLHLLDQIEDKYRGEQDEQPISTMQHSLSLNITKGRKFRQFLDLEQPASFSFVLSGFSQKVKSSSYPVAENFAISEKISLTITTSDLKSNNNQNLELIVLVVTPGDQKLIYALKLVEWRFVLVHKSLSIDIELAPYQHQGLSTLPCAGILSLQLQIKPLPKHFHLAEGSLNRQLQLEQKEKEFANNKFYSYANTFWNEIKQVHRSLQTRRIPIYAQTEDKVYLPLPKLVTPLYGVKGIDSPHHALRFCSLIPFLDAQVHRQKSFRRFSTFLAGKAGLIEDHCHLLCSLLLGMGLKAYVCVGTTGKGEHTWVMSEAGSSVTFWECSKGIKLDFFSPKALTYYRTINAVYNHRQYYANIQLDDSISGSKFNLRDSTLWKKMDDSILQELPSYNKGVALAYPNINSYSIQQQIESQLFKLIAEHRNKHKLSFSHDLILSSILTTALTNYEIERVTGQTFCEEEFQTAIKNYIPVRHTFKAFPIQLSTLEPRQIMVELQDHPKAREILNSKGESVCFGVRCKLVVFPDNVFALWVSLAIRYFRID